MDNSYQAFSSNPRYSVNGLETEIENEELAQARKDDSQAAAVTDLESHGFMLEETPKDEVSTGPDLIQVHEKIVGMVDAATRIPRDVVGGANKAINNTLNLIVGRENHDKANEWMRENLPGLTEFTDSFEKGHTANGTASEVTQEISQFMLPFGLYMKGLASMTALKGVTGTFSNAVLADIATSGTALDPHMERFSSVLKQLGVENSVIGWLADDSDDTGRLKNIIENTGMGVGLAIAFSTSAYTIKALYRASKEPVKKAIEKTGEVLKTTKGEPVKKDPVSRADSIKKVMDLLTNPETPDDIIGQMKELTKDLPDEVTVPKKDFPETLVDIPGELEKLANEIQ